MFKKDEYIVLLAGCDGGDTWPRSLPINHCYKLRKNSYEDKRGFHVILDTNGSDLNGWSCAGKYDSKLKMRYATPQEIAEYERLGKPFDVTELKSEIYEIF